jgi:hypothetical protein
MKGKDMTMQNTPDESQAFTRYRVDAQLFDEGMNLVEAYTQTQELYIHTDTFAVRTTRELPDGRRMQYEDRGEIGAHNAIVGATGFGGRLRGQVFPNGTVLLHGDGGSASFQMVATRMAPDHYRCLRKIEVRQSASFGAATPLMPGLYYVISDDHLLEASDEPPHEMKQPLRT